MDKPRDIQDRLMKLMLGRRRMVRDLLALLPAEWTAAVDASVLRELPTEFIGARGDKRTADLCWLAGGGPDAGPEGTGGFGRLGAGPEGAGAGKEGPGAGPAIVLIENQSAPDPRMPARTAARTGLLYESLGAAARGPDGKFPPLLIVVVYTGKRPWRAPDDLGGMARMPAGHPLSVPAPAPRTAIPPLAAVPRQSGVNVPIHPPTPVQIIIYRLSARSGRARCP